MRRLSRGILTSAVCALVFGAGCLDAVLYTAAAGTVYAARGCRDMCGENHLRCNEETGLCERKSCDGGCPMRTVCDTFRNECGPEVSW